VVAAEPDVLRHVFVTAAAGKFAQQTLRLSAGNVETLFAAKAIALHTRACFRLALAALLLTDVARLIEPFCWNLAQDDRLHRLIVAEPSFRDE